MNIKELIKNIDADKNVTGELIIRTENKELEIRDVVVFSNLAISNGVEKVLEDSERGYRLAYFEIDGWKIMIPSRY